jgi:putative membrane protein
MLEQALAHPFPTFNAIMNSFSLIFLVIGFLHIKKGDRVAHQKAMWTAFGFSAVFLASYLYYHFNYESNKFGATGVIRSIYFVILISHVILATAILPFIFRLLYLAQKGLYQKHKGLARWVWPAWIYTSTTGVLVYLMLYHWFQTKPS